MQAMAPGNREEPQAGHSVADAVPVGLEAPEAVPTEGECGAAATPADILGEARPPPAAPAPTAAPTGSAASAGTLNGLRQEGQATCLPAALSGTCIDRLQ